MKWPTTLYVTVEGMDQDECLIAHLSAYEAGNLTEDTSCAVYKLASEGRVVAQASYVPNKKQKRR
jgi:hypothetical protein